MTVIINTREDLFSLKGTDIYSQALRNILGSTKTWVNSATSGQPAQWNLISVYNTLNSLNLTLEELLSECEAAGIVSTTPPFPADLRFFTQTINFDGSLTLEPKDLNKLKATWSAQFKQTAYTMLLPSDWMVVRKQEDNTPVPADWSAYRTQVRLTCQLAVDGADATTDIEEFIAFVTTVEWPANPDAQLPV